MSSSAPLRRVLLVIIAVSVVLRLGSALYQDRAIEELPGVVDEVSYHELALRVIDGHGFSFATGWWPATRANQPTAHWSYLYVLFLSGLYSVFGPVTIWARLVQVVIVGVLHPLLTWRIGNRLFGSRVGLISAGFVALYGYFVFYAGALVTESLFFVAILWVADAATRLAADQSGFGRANSMAPWMLLGLAFSTAVLLRQAFLMVIPVVLLWLAWELGQRNSTPPGFRHVLSRGAVSLGVLALFVAPWTIRNYSAFGEFVPLNTNSGFVFYYGNHPAQGTRFTPLQPDSDYWPLVSADLADTLDTLNEAQIDRVLLREGIAFITADPLRFVQLSLSRTAEYFKFWPTPDSSPMSNVVRVLSFGVSLPFLLLGLFLALSRRHDSSRNGLRGAVLLLMMSLTYAGLHIVTWTLVRYRLPVDTLMMPFAGIGLAYLAHGISSLVPFRTVTLRNSSVTDPTA